MKNIKSINSFCKANNFSEGQNHLFFLGTQILFLLTSRFKEMQRPRREKFKVNLKSVHQANKVSNQDAELKGLWLF